MENSILVGDAGGTKTSWRFLEGDKISQFQTPGFNYTTHSIENFKHEIDSLAINPTITYLYIAGADTPEQRQTIEQEVSAVIGKNKVENDLLGAARAVLGDAKGYACILGTGSNASFYNGESIQKISASLGYLLGDEGSGAYLGRKLLKAAFRDQFEPDLIKAFHDYHQISIATTIKKIYAEEKPNLYLASFAKFISDFRNHPQIYQLIYQSFFDFFKEFFQEEIKDYPVNFVGSIAYHFSDILRQVGADLGFTIQNIIESPIAGLVLYHQKHG